VRLCVCQQAKREVRKFVDKMVTGKEAWADIQRMKYTAGQAPGLSLSLLFVAISKPRAGGLQRLHSDNNVPIKLLPLFRECCNRCRFQPYDCVIVCCFVE